MVYNNSNIKLSLPFQDFKDVNTKLADITVSEYTASELVRLCLQPEFDDDDDEEDDSDVNIFLILTFCIMFKRFASYDGIHCLIIPCPQNFLEQLVKLVIFSVFM